MWRSGACYLPSTPILAHIRRPLQGREGIFAVFLSMSQTEKPGELLLPWIPRLGGGRPTGFIATGTPAVHGHRGEWATTPESISGLESPSRVLGYLGLRVTRPGRGGGGGGARRPAELRDKGPRADVAGPGGPFKRGGRAARVRAGAGRGGRRRRRRQQRLVLGDSDRFGQARPARRWARKTAMPPRRSIVEVKVLDVQKRRVPNKHYVSLRPRHAATPAPRRTCAPRPPCRLSPHAPLVPAPSPPSPRASRAPASSPPSLREPLPCPPVQKSGPSRWGRRRQTGRETQPRGTSQPSPLSFWAWVI